MTDVWIFAYGSLIWNPGFAWHERVPARLFGYRRRFCLRSTHYRGTPERPGLVLALEREPRALCLGLAYAVDARIAEETLEYLRGRELVSSAYRETWVELQLATGPSVRAVTYVIDRSHSQYWTGLTLAEQAEIIAKAQGKGGSNADYLYQTAANLSALGLPDPDLTWLAARVRALQERATEAQETVGNKAAAS